MEYKKITKNKRNWLIVITTGVTIGILFLILWFTNLFSEIEKSNELWSTVGVCMTVVLIVCVIAVVEIFSIDLKESPNERKPLN